ncbi:MaoC/PaaZ C-terminal domain-containing protein [Bacillus dakarensis]|uniref:MaoC family dehydratase n=1 Tax=Robertmurraya dakarensis TaxID=1926278 RepID=UPI000980AF15|nr:MaoC/PaaZ C-terminal domain-containing protein [Bacillus dakarensis]
MKAFYYEDFEVGMCFDSPARTITETDVVMFAGFSGDYNAIHTDTEYCKNTQFGERIAHGLLGISIITGLMSRAGTFEGTAIAMLGINNWKFLKPIFIGDTVYVRYTITEKRPSKSNPETGIVNRFYELINQKGEVVQNGEMPVLIKRNLGK